MAKDIETKREREKRVVVQMIGIYCNGNHGTKKGCMCDECRELADYACFRSDKCPFMETKTFCANCKVHCYKPEKREAIRKVMRYAGPRMIFHDPVMAVRHVIETKKEKARLEKETKN